MCATLNHSGLVLVVATFIGFPQLQVSANHRYRPTWIRDWPLWSISIHLCSCCSIWWLISTLVVSENSTSKSEGKCAHSYQFAQQVGPQSNATLVLPARTYEEAVAWNQQARGGVKDLVVMCARADLIILGSPNFGRYPRFYLGLLTIVGWLQHAVAE